MRLLLRFLVLTVCLSLVGPRHRIHDGSWFQDVV